MKLYDGVFIQHSIASGTDVPLGMLNKHISDYA